MRILVIDNYDSFTYNIVQLVGELLGELAGGLEGSVLVRRNDRVTLAEISALEPSHIIISPGPGTPDDAGISRDLIRGFHRTLPIFGVCLGHQCIGDVFGGSVVRARRLVHGKTSSIFHDGRSLFHDLPNPFVATRYHSLIVADPLPDCLEVTAWTTEGEIMGLRHKRWPIEGVQFHPESILTEYGRIIMRNFLAMRASSESPLAVTAR